MPVLSMRSLAKLCAAFGLAFAQTCLADEAQPLAVIVSSKPELAMVTQLAPHELSLIYWRKKQYWQDGVRIHPVNLHAEHPLRLSFSKTVLGSAPTDQNDYWNGLYFHGTTPPYSVQSEEAVLRYISDTKGAIGYVDACKVDTRVKAMLWIVNEKISATKPEKLSCANVP